jgi:methionyl-tRNA synthetase
MGEITTPELPDTASGVTVITIPPPTANGPLHVGHLSGPYLASDIAARAARARGRHVLAVAGIDVGQNFIATMAEARGLPAGPMMARFRAEILEAFDRGRIRYDTFIDPQEPYYQRSIAGLLRDMVERGMVPMREMTLHACEDCGRTLHHSYVAGTCPWCRTGASGGSCEGCGGFTSAQTLMLPTCDRCGGAPRAFAATVPVLCLEDLREPLVALWLRTELPRRVRELIARYLTAGLPEIPLAYPTNWGIEGDGPLSGMRIDVYAEVGLAWLYGVARALQPGAATLDECVAGWRAVDELWQFHGIDNAFYFAVLWPALFAAAGLDRAPLRGLVVNELATLDGKKFSTSRNHAIWAHQFLATEDPSIVRLYLAWDRPDRASTDFTMESFAAFRDDVGRLLSGGVRPGSLPAPLLRAERARGERALELTGFDPSLAARSLVSLLAAGECDPGPILAAVTGTDDS